MAIITYRDAINQAMAEEIARDSDVFIMGEEVAQYKGAYKVTRGLLEKFGPERIIDAPISEAGFCGLGVGAAMMGLRPVVEFMFWSFCYVAFDQVINNAANIRYMSGGLINIPIVFRGPGNGGTNVGATHSHTPENFVANTPGLKVVCPSTPYDAKGLLKSAIRDNDPVFVMENTLLYGNQGEVPEDDYVIPLGVAEVKKEGSDILSYLVNLMKDNYKYEDRQTNQEEWEKLESPENDIIERCFEYEDGMPDISLYHLVKIFKDNFKIKFMRERRSSRRVPVV